MMRLTEDEQALLDTCCCLCLEETVFTAGNYRFCELHKFRGELLLWGLDHGYPLIETGSVAVGKGAYHWTIAATLGNDDMIYTLLGVIEMIDNKAV